MFVNAAKDLEASEENAKKRINYIWTNGVIDAHRVAPTSPNVVIRFNSKSMAEGIYALNNIICKQEYGLHFKPKVKINQFHKNHSK